MTFHSVRKSHTEVLGPNGELTLPDTIFEKIVQQLSNDGYQCITCLELFKHLQSGDSLPKKPVLLSFDDGYLDNWTIAAPILKKYGMKGTVFVATDFIDHGTTPRPTLEDSPSPPEQGYLNSSELLALENSGVMEIQSHTARHSRVPISDKIIDFHRPQRRDQWLERNAATPEQLSLEHQGATAVVPWGTPVFQHHWSSPAKMFLPNPILVATLQNEVSTNGNESFFEHDNWRNRLEEKSNEFSCLGEFETESAQRARLLADFKSSKETLENILGHEVPFLAWPGGGSSKLAVDLAIDEVGFLATIGTNRVCPGVNVNIRAIPRAYFRQDYRGKLDQELRTDLCTSILDWEAGRLKGYIKGFITRRRMSLNADSSFPNKAH